MIPSQSVQLHLGENAWNPYANIPLLTSDPRTGQTFVNRAKYAQKVVWLGAAPYPLSLAANGRDRCALSPPPDQGGAGDAEMYLWWGTSTGQFAVMLKALGLGNIKLMNQPVESSLLFGSSPSLAGRLLQPIFAPATTSIDLELTDLSGSANTVRIVGLGCQIVDPMATMGKSIAEVRAAAYNPNVVPYWLTFDAGAQITVPANSSGYEVTMTVPSEGDFNAWGLLMRATSATGLTVEIFEGNRRRLMDRPIRCDQLAALTGTVASQAAASLPLILPFTHTFQRKTQLTLRFVESSGSDNVVSACWPGQVVYFPESPPGLVVAGPPAASAAKVLPASPTYGPVPGGLLPMQQNPGLMGFPYPQRLWR